MTAKEGSMLGKTVLFSGTVLGVARVDQIDGIEKAKGLARLRERN